MNIEPNFKKLLCYKIINNIECSYKSKCMFAHNIEEQKKDNKREFIYNLINKYDNISYINLYEDKELMNDLIIYTKECKSCILNKCPGGYNCKFGACTKDLVICYNDLCYGKCTNSLKVVSNSNNVKIHRCINGIHLTEKKLLPYSQRITSNINIASFGENINYFNKQMIISIIINDFTMPKIKTLLNKNNNKINNVNIFQDLHTDISISTSTSTSDIDNDNDNDSLDINFDL
jgi:hypothetical protein